MLEDAFYTLIDSLDASFARSTGSQLLETLCDEFKLAHIAYLGVNLPLKDDCSTYIVATYHPDWIARYQAQNYVSIDPVVQTGMRGILPFDWRDAPRKEPTVVNMFGEAHEHGVGNHGLTFPIRGTLGERAWFSINVECTETEWAARKKASMREFQMIAYHFHTHVLEVEGCVERRHALLSKQELECLKWAAAGKTSSETATIISRSPSTVNLHLETARTKLHAVNKVQAVAKAVSMQLL